QLDGAFRMLREECRLVRGFAAFPPFKELGDQEIDLLAGDEGRSARHGLSHPKECGAGNASVAPQDRRRESRHRSSRSATCGPWSSPCCHGTFPSTRSVRSVPRRRGHYPCWAIRVPLLSTRSVRCALPRRGRSPCCRGNSPSNRILCRTTRVLRPSAR